jgi:hypothetical protein
MEPNGVPCGLPIVSRDGSTAMRLCGDSVERSDFFASETTDWDDGGCNRNPASAAPAPATTNNPTVRNFLRTPDPQATDPQ